MTKTVNKSRNDESNLTALERHQQFRQDTYHDRGLLFCKTCNVVVNHKRKSIVLDHIKSQDHEDKKNRLTCDDAPRQRTITTTLPNSKVQSDGQIKVGLVMFRFCHSV